ncbi:hypothetical protein [Vibrio fortis]|uniref:hypothetical protein n=1 Tax=Vibrio fortis TaxID=212667 RepID=UPI0021C40F9B|nr:hypothetical protein [Vibrio fortis]
MTQIIVFKESENLSLEFQNYIQNFTEKDIVVVKRKANGKQSLLRDLEQVSDLISKSEIELDSFSDTCLLINYDEPFEEVYKRDIDELDNLDELTILMKRVDSAVIETASGLVELKDDWLSVVQDLAVDDKEALKKARSEYHAFTRKLGNVRDMNQALSDSEIVICDMSKKDFSFFSKDTGWNEKISKALRFSSVVEAKSFVDNNDIKMSSDVILYNESLYHFYMKRLENLIREKDDEIARLSGYSR